MKRCLILLCVFLSCSIVQGQKSVRRLAGRGRRSNSGCVGVGTECQCRRGKHYEQKLICTKEDCMRKLPTDNIPRDQVRRVVSLIVTRQPNITSIGSVELRRLGNIRDIRITRCKVSFVAPTAFVGLNSVHRLDLHRNELENVPPAIRYLQNLKYLNLGGNKIKNVRTGAFLANRNLERLVLGRNILNLFPERLPPSLVKISVSKNQLTSLGDLRYLKKLKIMYADRNNLTRFPQLPISVKVVNLCSNLIDQEITLREFTNLTVVNLSNNKRIGDIKMSTFTGEVSRSPSSSLTRFEASNSGIRSVSANAFRCIRKLKHIDISDNEITNYHDTWFHGNKALRSVFLNRNPFVCTCDIKSNLLEMGRHFSTTIGQNMQFNGTFNNDFDEILCSNEEKEPCIKFKFLEEACTAEETAVIPTTTKRLISTVVHSTTSTSTTVVGSSTAVPRPTASTTASTTSPSSTSATSTVTTTKPHTTTTRSTIASPTTTTRPGTTSLATTTRPTTPTTTVTSTKTSTKAVITTTTSSQTTTPVTTSKIIIIPPTESVDLNSATTESESVGPDETIAENKWCQQANGEPCVFPFFNGVEEMNECVPARFGRTWCSTTGKYNEDGSWDYCEEC